MAGFSGKVNRKVALIVASCVALAAFAVGGVWAYLISRSGTINNSFVPAKVTCAVEEQFENGVKQNVTVRNTGDVDAFIRATVVATFRSADGKVLSIAPKEGVDYTATFNLTGWKKGSDGFWYYPVAVSPNEVTAALIDGAESVTTPEGYRLHLQIIATAIQADPIRAAQEAWGVNVSNGQITPN